MSYVEGITVQLDAGPILYRGYVNDQQQRHGPGRSEYESGDRTGIISFGYYQNGASCGPFLQLYTDGSKRLGYDVDSLQQGQGLYIYIDRHMILERYVDDVQQAISGDQAAEFIKKFEGLGCTVNNNLADDDMVASGFELLGPMQFDVVYTPPSVSLKFVD